MAGSSEMERERPNVPAVSTEVAHGAFKLSLNIYDRWSAFALSVGVGVGIAAVGVGIAALCIRNPQLVTDTLKKALEVTAETEVGRVQPGSILVELHCHTKESFLLFMDDFKSKNVERRLNLEFGKIGYNEELEVTIINVKEANMHLKQLRGERAPLGKVKEEPRSEVFISYNWGIQNLVVSLKRKLEEAGFHCWKDISKMGGGDNMRMEIDAGIRASKVVICCITNKYCNSPMCVKEADLAASLKKPIIPVLFEKIKWPPEQMGMIFGGSLLYINMSQTPDELPEDKLTELITQVKKFIAESE